MRSVRLFALLTFLVSASSFATVFAPMSDRELVDRSDAIVVGTVTASAPRAGAGGTIYTDYQLAVEEVLKGSLERGASVTISEVGGEIDGRAMFIAASAKYTVGERVLTFLRQRPDGTWYTSGMTRGAFTFDRNIAGEPVVVRDLADEMPNEPVRLRDGFIEFIRATVAGVSTASRYMSASPETTLRHFVPTTNGTAKNFAITTTTGIPFRWDCGQRPINTSLPCNIPKFNQNRTPTAGEAAAIDAGAAAWTGDPNANIAFSRGVVQNETPPPPPIPPESNGNNNPNDNKNTVFFDQSTLPSGYCDAGIACTIIAGNFTGQFDGDTWVLITDADVLILSGKGTAAVITHELGHGIGIKHGPSGNVMSPSPALTTLQSWDRDAVDSLYGNGPACQPITTATISPSSRQVAAGSTLTLQVANDGSDSPFTYQWFLGNSGDTSTPAPGANTGKTYTTPPINASSTFWVRVKNACTAAGRDAASVTYTPTVCTKPAITTQPQSQAIGSGTTATLSVGASGSSPFTYQWFEGTFPDTSKQVATTASFTTPALTTATSYWVRVSNACGSADSTTARITIIGQCTKPAFTVQPKSRTINSPRAVALVATSSGDGLTYQWFRATSPNQQNPQTGLDASDTRFVRQLYVDLLGRDPDGPTTGILIGLLQGSTRQGVALSVLTSPEYRSELISSYYRAYLRRSADADGLAFFLSLLSSGSTDEEVAADLLGSSDYYIGVAGGTPAGLTNQLYNDVLGRNPSASEAGSTVTLLTNGVSRTDVALLLLRSAEARQRLVSGWFETFLRRSATGAELSSFAGALGNSSDEQVLASILGSDEYNGFGSVLITGNISSLTSFWVFASNTCGSANSDTATISVSSDCSTASAPVIVTQPQNTSTITGTPAVVGVGVTGTGPFGFQWFEGTRGNTSNPISGATSAQLQLLTNAVTTRTVWVRITNACNKSVDSNNATITVNCGAPTPQVFADTSVRSGLPHKVSWEGSSSLYSSFELQIANNSDFTNAETQTVPAVQLPGGTLNEKSFTNTVSADTRFYYRVRGKAACNGNFSAYSSAATTLVTAPQPADAPNLVLNVGGNTTFGLITQDLFIPGFSTNGKTALATVGSFTVTSDRDFVTVVPSSGPLPAEGTTVKVNLDPSKLEIGSTQANLVINATDGLAKGVLGASRTTTTSVSASRTTPATSTPKDANAPADTLLVLAVGHGIGASGPFQSDVRVSNTGAVPRNYQLTFTPAQTDGTTTGRQTTLTINPGETKALDDIVSAWFAAGGLGEATLGTLEVRPLAVQGGGGGSGVSKTTTASSRTYFVKSNGATFGQFIPALPLAQFLAKSNSAKISIQQIQQNAASRTNVGIVEGSGQPATVEVRLLDANNNQLGVKTLQLRPFEFIQASLDNQFLFFPGVSANDARLEVKVLSDTGRVSAYASVVENKTADPTLIFPKFANQVSSNRYVVPGVANLIGALNSNFHTDLRVYNAGTNAVPVTMSFSGPVGAPSVSFTVNPGQVLSFNDVVKSKFNLEGVGGAIVATTAANSSLVLTARTYTIAPDGGTFGQFIPGVTPSEGIGATERALQLLQLEQSPAFRSNAGVVEVAGQPAKVRLSLYNPDSKTIPSIDVDLAANQFVQLGNIFTSVGMKTVYNGRISVQVLSGAGRVSAYGSLIDNRSNDPAFIPAQ